MKRAVVVVVAVVLVCAAAAKVEVQLAWGGLDTNTDLDLHAKASCGCHLNAAFEDTCAAASTLGTPFATMGADAAGPGGAETLSVGAQSAPPCSALSVWVHAYELPAGTAGFPLGDVVNVTVAGSGSVGSAGGGGGSISDDELALVFFPDDVWENGTMSATARFWHVCDLYFFADGSTVVDESVSELLDVETFPYPPLPSSCGSDNTVCEYSAASARVAVAPIAVAAAVCSALLAWLFF